MTPFLTPREAREATRCLAARLRAGTALLVGGYPGAERVRAILLPDYLEGLTDPRELSDDPVVALAAAGFEEIAAAISAAVVPVRIKGSGYRVLSHRDYLGALLHLGVERDRIGDICVISPHEAILFCDRVMVGFFTENLTRVANDAVRLSVTEVAADFDGGRTFLPISDTVASPRADAVVAALANLSRERAQALFREGRVEIDYSPEERIDRTVGEGAVIVIRGCGKFIIRALSDKTKKGRFRLLADKYN